MTEDTKPKLDLFEVLSKIDKSDMDYFNNLDDDLKKQFTPLLTMRWASSSGGMQTVLLNSLVNTTVFKLNSHPNLLYKLLIASSNKKNKRYEWIKKKSKDKSKPVTVDIIKKYYNCPAKDARIYSKRLPIEDILDMAEALGYDSDIVKEIKNEFK